MLRDCGVVLAVVKMAGWLCCTLELAADQCGLLEDLAGAWTLRSCTCVFSLGVALTCCCCFKNPNKAPTRCRLKAPTEVCASAPDIPVEHFCAGISGSLVTVYCRCVQAAQPPQPQPPQPQAAHAVACLWHAHDVRELPQLLYLQCPRPEQLGRYHHRAAS